LNVPRLLVVHSSFDGQTERIAERIRQVAMRAGVNAYLIDAEAGELDWAIADADAVIVGGAIRYGHHAKSLVAAIRTHRSAIEARPNAFYSVCLSAGGPGARPANAVAYIDEFLERTGWQPQRIASFAGALRYTTYNPFIRFMMRIIVGMAGGDTDTSRDYEYTDWSAVERFAGEFAARLQPARAA
jgi:menaquinone-dependent protoporphyrinogen oxidase